MMRHPIPDTTDTLPSMPPISPPSLVPLLTPSTAMPFLEPLTLGVLAFLLQTPPSHPLRYLLLFLSFCRLLLGLCGIYHTAPHPPRNQSDPPSHPSLGPIPPSCT